MKPQSRTIFFGPPGTGKTKTLLDRVAAEIRAGVAPDQIAFVAFSRRAAKEARERAMLDLSLSEDDLKWWKTLHATASAELGIAGQVLAGRHWEILGDNLGMEFDDLDESGRVTSMKQDIGHRVQTIYYLRRSQLKSMEWGPLVKDLGERLAYQVCRFHKTIGVYKEKYNLYDYADLLDLAPGNVCPRVILLDEAQDLTAQQWEYFKRLSHAAEKIYIAGDDEQALFSWAGADVEQFLAQEGEKIVLDVSYRLPKKVFEVAQRISSSIQVKAPKTWRPSEREGAVVRAMNPNRLEIGSGSWLLLSRTRMGLGQWESICRLSSVRYISAGVDSVKDEEVYSILMWESARKGMALDKEQMNAATAYSHGAMPGTSAKIWREALSGIPLVRRQYYETILRAHGTAELRNPARIRIDTIHGAKGAEADQVAVLPDLTPRIEQGRTRDPDAEHRVWYVAATRCKEVLYMITPQTDLYYAI